MADNVVNELVRVHIWVRGRVQGVGFRSYVAYQAGKIGIFGWVRNVADDTVEIIAEGAPGPLNHFAYMVEMGPRAARVDECRVEHEHPTGEFPDFIVNDSR